MEVAEACGAVMGNCHAGTHVQAVPSELSAEYMCKYKNTEHFELWNEHFFPMSLERLRDTTLFRQTDDVAPFGYNIHLLITLSLHASVTFLSVSSVLPSQ